MSSADISDWVFEGVLQFLKSPLWTMPVHGFIEQHCHEFAAGEEENKLIYTQLHNEFRTLVDNLLSSFLDQLGVSCEAFVDAIKSGANEELSSIVTEFLYALDDFSSFRTLMEKKNVELELEAMYEYAKYSSQAQLGQAEVDEMSDEERFLFEMAIQMSLGEQEFVMKRVEQQDAELLQALALSIAIEQERLLYEQLLAEAESNGEEAPEKPANLVASPARTVEQIQQEVHQQRVANVERALFDISSGTASVPVPAPSSTANNTQSEEARKIVEKSLAPLAEKRSAAFGAKGPALPCISSLSSVAPAPLAVAPVPSFESLKKDVEQKMPAAAVSATQKAGEPSKEELEQRAAYFKAQREKMLQQKQAARAQELEVFKQQQQLPSPSTSTTVGAVSSGAQGTSSAGESDATREMRLALARRFKEDLIQESKKQKE